MNIERGQQIKSVVASALETPEAERAGFVRFECGNDVDLREEVESLLAAAATADSLPEARIAIASAAGAVVAEQDATLRTLLESAFVARRGLLLDSHTREFSGCTVSAK